MANNQPTISNGGTMKLENVPIEKIVPTHRYREDMGDLEGLAQSIQDLGLLQPIGITKYYELVFGARRLEACADILGWTEIPCHILDFDSILLGEYSENEFRKEFTVSERVAIAKAVEEELGKRQGQHGDKYPEVQKGRTRELAAKRAGFGSDFTYRQATAVVELGSPEIVAAMDTGEISVSAAEAIVRAVPKDEHAAVARMPKNKKRQAVKDAKAKLAAKRLADGKTHAYMTRRYIDDLSKSCVPPETLWFYAGEFGWAEFPDHVENALRYLIRIKEAHPNARKKLQAVAKPY